MADKHEDEKVGVNSQFKMTIIIMGCSTFIMIGLIVVLYFTLNSQIQSGQQLLVGQLLNANKKDSVDSKITVKTKGQDKVKGEEAKTNAEKTSTETKESESESEKPKPIFYKFAPPFIINIANKDSPRYLQIEISIMSHDQKALEAAESIAPLLRNNLIIYFSNVQYDAIQTAQAKEDLRLKLLEIVKKDVKENTGYDIEQLFFNNFIIQ